MFGKLKSPLLVAVALSAALLAGIEIMHIGRVFEEKSLYSYFLKNGDTDSSGQAALIHVRGMAAYGRTVALRVGFGSAIFGVLLGFFAARWLMRRSGHAA